MAFERWPVVDGEKGMDPIAHALFDLLQDMAPEWDEESTTGISYVNDSGDVIPPSNIIGERVWGLMFACAAWMSFGENEVGDSVSDVLRYASEHEHIHHEGWLGYGGLVGEQLKRYSQAFEAAIRDTNVLDPLGLDQEPQAKGAAS